MKKRTVNIICYTLFALFVYAALSKLFTFNTYIYDLKRSAYIGKFSWLLSYALPALELTVAVTLLIDRTRILALYTSAALMFLFTLYVGILLKTVDYEPCTCGALIRELTWKQHLWFNTFFTLLALVGILLERKIVNNTGDNSRQSFKPSL